eukprot:TRINITY_DN16404_c0_g1_i1.p1 TRINITY_DN16404_c0_g1~~TRINITY_DN16404_c0_g1_i1.p1  ORF type:complete len:441 (+),score=67.86 TRINITY_DN16404_c0_g1_i1:80-1402(+)
MPSLRVLTMFGLFWSGWTARKEIRIKEDRSQERTVLPAQPVVSDDACPEGSLLEVTFDLEDSTDKLYANVQGFSSHVVSESDVFEYEMMWVEEGANANVDIEAGTVQWRLRDDESIKDQHGFRNHCEHERLGGLPVNKFMKRSFHLTSISGKHLDTLLVSANPGFGKRVTILLKYIRIVRKNNVVIHLWDSTSAPLKAVAYFPGKVTTQCKQSYALRSNGGCRSELDKSGKGWRDGKLEAIPMVLLSSVSCHFTISFLEGSTEENVVELSEAEVTTTVVSSFSKKPLYNNTIAFPSLLISSEEPPQDLDLSFMLGNETDIVCCSPMLMSLFNESTLSATMKLRDIHTAAETVVQLISAPLRLMCSLVGEETTNEEIDAEKPAINEGDIPLEDSQLGGHAISDENEQPVIQITDEQVEDSTDDQIPSEPEAPPKEPSTEEL